MVGHGAPVEGGDAPHGIDDVLVEAGEEAEPVLAWQVMLDRVDAGIHQHVRGDAVAAGRHRNAARLAAGDVAPLEDDDLNAAFDELVRGAHPRNAATEHDGARPHAPAHASPLRRFAAAMPSPHFCASCRNDTIAPGSLMRSSTFS